MTIVDDILDLFSRRGATAYYGEAVLQTEHALQAAGFGADEGAADHLIIGGSTIWGTCLTGRPKTLLVVDLMVAMRNQVALG